MHCVKFVQLLLPHIRRPTSREIDLAAKKITILLLPDGSSKTRQLKIPKAVFFFSFLFIFAGILGLSWLVQDYWVIKKQMPRLAGLEKENKTKNEQLVALAQRINTMSKKMAESRQFDNQLRVMVNLEPNEDNNQFLGIGGSEPTIQDPDLFREKNHRKLVREMHKSLDILDTEISAQTKSKATLCSLLENQKSVLASTPSIWPTRGWVSSRFGYRISPFTKKKEFHRGLDICTRVGAPIIAPADGVVSYVGNDYGYGNVIVINHNNGIKTRYAHLRKALVKKGQSVKRGEKVALVGKTGRTTGPHLHYEVHLNGVSVDPLRYILN